jgi:acyl carrier protein
MEQKEIKEYLASLICESMYMEREELEEDALFSDFGLESTTLVKILNKIDEKYNFQLKVEELLSHQTLNEASIFIYEKLTIKTI